jgi:hypothetical protein
MAFDTGLRLFQAIDQNKFTYVQQHFSFFRSFLETEREGKTKGRGCFA